MVKIWSCIGGVSLCYGLTHRRAVLRDSYGRRGLLIQVASLASRHGQETVRAAFFRRGVLDIIVRIDAQLILAGCGFRSGQLSGPKL